MVFGTWYFGTPALLTNTQNHRPLTDGRADLLSGRREKSANGERRPATYKKTTGEAEPAREGDMQGWVQ